MYIAQVCALACSSFVVRPPHSSSIQFSPAWISLLIYTRALMKWTCGTLFSHSEKFHVAIQIAYIVRTLNIAHLLNGIRRCYFISITPNAWNASSAFYVSVGMIFFFISFRTSSGQCHAFYTQTSNDEHRIQQEQILKYRNTISIKFLNRFLAMPWLNRRQSKENFWYLSMVP